MIPTTLSWLRRRWAGGCLLALLAFAAVLPSHAHAASSAPSNAVPKFSLPDLRDDAHTVALKDFQGKVLLLNLWASWCTGCRKEMVEFLDLQRAYREKKFEIVAVNLDDRKENALSFLRKFAQQEGRRLEFLTLYDKDKTLASGLNPKAFPASYLIDGEGRLVKTYEGSISAKELPLLKREIDGLLGKLP